MIPKQIITLSPIAQVKLELYREFGSDAKDVFDFIMSDANACEAVATIPNNITNPNEDEDGVYIVNKDGSYEPYDDHNSKENVKYVGVISGKHRIAVALHNIGGEDKEYQFLKDSASAPAHSVFYSREYLTNAFEDFAGIKNTRHIIEDYDSEIPFELFEDGEYIASIGEWGVLMSYASRINEALEFVGGTPIKGWMWSSTELSQYSAWNVYFTDGTTSIGSKCRSHSVRAVAAF